MSPAVARRAVGGQHHADARARARTSCASPPRRPMGRAPGCCCIPSTCARLRATCSSACRRCSARMPTACGPRWRGRSRSGIRWRSRSRSRVRPCATAPRRCTRGWWTRQARRWASRPPPWSPAGSPSQLRATGLLLTDALAPGAYTIVVEARQASGKRSRTHAIPITLDAADGRGRGRDTDGRAGTHADAARGRARAVHAPRRAGAAGDSHRSRRGRPSGARCRHGRPRRTSISPV